MHDSNYEALTQVSCRPARVKCVGSHSNEMDLGEHLWGESHYGSSHASAMYKDWHIHATWLKIVSPVGEKCSWFDKITHCQSY